MKCEIGGVVSVVLALVLERECKKHRGRPNKWLFSDVMTPSFMAQIYSGLTARL
jgi:hypothetical protein